MPIWELIENCVTGSYIAGATFVNELQQEIYFDGHSIKGLDQVSLQSTWAFVEPKIA